MSKNLNIKNDVEYPKPKDWEWMTDQDRYTYLQAQPLPSTNDLKHALESARQQVRQDMRDENLLFQEARLEPLLADCPRCSLVLRGPPTLAVFERGYSFTATLTYDFDPSGENRRLVFDAEHGFFYERGPSEGFYSVYPSEECRFDERIHVERTFQGKGGRRDFEGRYGSSEVGNLEGWKEVGPGESVEKEVRLELRGYNTSEPLQVGKTYWLRYDRRMTAGLTKLGGFGVPRTWRYGGLEEWKATLPWQMPYNGTGMTSLPISQSNTIKFQVVQESPADWSRSHC